MVNFKLMFNIDIAKQNDTKNKLIWSIIPEKLYIVLMISKSKPFYI